MYKIHVLVSTDVHSKVVEIKLKHGEKIAEMVKTNT